MLKRSLVVFLIAATATFAFAREHKDHQPKLTPQNSGTTQLLIAVSPVNPRVVWAAGTGGTFVVTTDGGDTWKAAVVPGAEALQFRDVQGVSDKVAYLMSIGSNTTDFRIYKTEDGGATWTIEFTNQTTNAFYDCFAFWTPTRGITHSDSVNGVFPDIRTTDGMTWQSIAANMPLALTGEASFAASGTCITTQGEGTPGLPPAARPPRGYWPREMAATPGTRMTLRWSVRPARARSPWPSATRGMASWAAVTWPQTIARTQQPRTTEAKPGS